MGIKKRQTKRNLIVLSLCLLLPMAINAAYPLLLAPKQASRAFVNINPDSNSDASIPVADSQYNAALTDVLDSSTEESLQATADSELKAADYPPADTIPHSPKRTTGTGNIHLSVQLQVQPCSQYRTLSNSAETD